MRSRGKGLGRISFDCNGIRGVAQSCLGEASSGWEVAKRNLPPRPGCCRGGAESGARARVALRGAPHHLSKVRCPFSIPTLTNSTEKLTRL